MRPLLPLMLAMASALVAQAPAPEAEPNDAPAQAQTVVVGDQVEAAIGTAGDVDWFRFTLAASGVVSVATSGGYGVGTDTLLEVWDAGAAALLAADDDAGGLRGDGALVTVALTAGTYLVLVRHAAPAGTGVYQFEVATTVVPPPTAAEGPEPNHAPALGGTPTLIPADGRIAGHLTAGDTDWYRVVLAVPTGLYAQVGDDAAAPQLDDAVLSWFDANAQPFGPAANQPFSARATQVTQLGPGTWFLAVSGAAAASAGHYVLQLAAMPMTALPVPEAPEPNGSAATATPLPQGHRGLGSISAGDGDYWRITIVAPVMVQMQTGDGASPTLTDATLRLRDATGQVVYGTSGAIAGPPASSHGRLTFTIASPGDFLLEVTGGTPWATGNYVLDLGAVPAPYVSADYATFGTGCPGGNGTPVLSAAVGETPWLGSSFVQRIANCPPSTVLVHFIGGSITAAGATTLPFDLGVFGAPGCLLRVANDVTLLTFADAQGNAFRTLRVPASLALRATLLYGQAAVLDLPANTLGLTLTNAAIMLAGDRAR